MKRLLITTIVPVAVALLGLDQVTGKAATVGSAEAPPVSLDLHKEIQRMDGVLSGAFNTQI
jgi:hypothetical protein